MWNIWFNENFPPPNTQCRDYGTNRRWQSKVHDVDIWEADDVTDGIPNQGAIPVANNVTICVRFYDNKQNRGDMRIVTNDSNLGSAGQIWIGDSQGNVRFKSDDGILGTYPQGTP